MDEKTEAVFAQLMAADTKEKTPTEVLQAFSEHFVPQKNVILKRYRFNSRIQKTDESVDRFITALHKLAEACQYGTMKDELIRDRLIVGLLDTKTSMMLRLKSHLTLEDAMTIARQTDPPRAQPESDDNAEESPKHNVLLFPSITCISGPFWDLSTKSTGNVQYRQYNNVQKVLNDLSPRNFDKTVNQLQALQIDSEEMLWGVVDLIYAKAIAVPQLGSSCARICKHLSMLRVGSPDDQGGEEKHPIHLKDLVLTRQSEFKKDFEEIETLSDPRKKKEILLAYIGFMHEIHKQLMIPLILLLSVIQYCVEQMSKGSLECLKPYFEQMLNIHHGKDSEISQMIRSMLRDVSELTFNKLRKDNLQTNDEIEKDTKTESPGHERLPREKNSLLVCHQNDVQLREIDNPWRRGQQRPGYIGEGDLETNALHKSVQRLLNKLTPQKFNTLVNQLRSLKIDTEERLQGVVDLVFDYAIRISSVTQLNYCVGYALMCRELCMMQVSGSNTKAGKEESNVNFRKLIITRCQMEFEKNTVDENARAIKIKEIEACPDPDKKKQLLHTLNEEERKIRVKSVGNIRFIGELFRQGMLTTNIMHRCIRHLLMQTDEGSLECLCKLLSTIGKDLESKGQCLDGYFKQILEIVIRKGSGEVSSRVRFMLQDVVELSLNKWVPRSHNSDPKTMDQIRKEAEADHLDTHLNNTPMNTQRKDDRNSDRNRNLGSGPTEEGDWRRWVRSSLTQYSVETSKLKNKPPPMDNLQIGNKNMFQWSRNVSADAPKTVKPSKFAILENINSEQDKRSALPLSGSRPTGPKDYGRQDYKSSYDSRHSRNGREQLNIRSSSRDSSLDDSSRSQRMSMPPPHINSIPPTAPVSTPVKSAPRMTEEQLAKKTADILDKYLSDTNVKKLEFLFGDSNSSNGSLSAQLNMEQIHERLRSLISNEKQYSFRHVVSWISANVGGRAKEPQFIRVLMTAILEVSIEPYNQTWKFKAEKFQNLQTLISRYIDTNDLLELNCLIAIQEYIHKLEHPSGVLLQVIEKLSDANIVSDEAFLAWEINKDPTAQTGKSVAMMALTSFFTSLKEAADDSTSDEA